MRRGLYVAPFDELAEPRTLIALAVEAEEHGWDGFFLWDHILYRPPVRAVADPWVALSAIAAHTEHLRVGPLVTPLSRRRVHKVARETATLDRLSRGRLILGVGLGSDRYGELERFDEVVDARERARRLDAGLDRLTAFWDGEFEPQPVQRPRIPIWVAARWPHRRPLRRAARWDGIFPIELPGPGALAELAAEISGLRADDPKPLELVVDLEPGLELAPWRKSRSHRDPDRLRPPTADSPRPRGDRTRPTRERSMTEPPKPPKPIDWEGREPRGVPSPSPA